MSEYRTLLVPYDFSTHADAALAEASNLARRLGGADVHLVHVVQPPVHFYGYAAYGGSNIVAPPIDMEEVRSGAMKSLQELVARVPDPPGKLEPHVVEGPNVADAIRRSAEEFKADLIVMGTHGRTGLAHVFLGSVAERTLRRAPCPVLTVQAVEDGGEEE